MPPTRGTAGASGSGASSGAGPSRARSAAASASASRSASGSGSGSAAAGPSSSRAAASSSAAGSSNARAAGGRPRSREASAAAGAGAAGAARSQQTSAGAGGSAGTSAAAAAAGLDRAQGTGRRTPAPVAAPAPAPATPIGTHATAPDVPLIAPPHGGAADVHAQGQEQGQDVDVDVDMGDALAPAAGLSAMQEPQPYAIDGSTTGHQPAPVPAPAAASAPPRSAAAYASASASTSAAPGLGGTTADGDAHLWAGLPPWLLSLTGDAHRAMLASTHVRADERYTVARLVQRAEAYARPETAYALAHADGAPSAAPPAHALPPPDYASAYLYAYLALCLDARSVPARRLVAAALLRADGAPAGPFPFAPSNAAAPPPGTPAAGANAGAQASAAAAQAALHVLEQGASAGAGASGSGDAGDAGGSSTAQSVFADAECARLYADACRRLGRFRDAEEALSWTFQLGLAESAGAEPSAANAKAGAAPVATADELASLAPPPLRACPADAGAAALSAGEARAQAAERASRAQSLASMGDLALAGNRHADAADAHRAALADLDAWCWRAWAGFCDAGAGTGGAGADPAADWAAPGASASAPGLGLGAGAAGKGGGSAAPVLTAARAFDAQAMALAAHRAADFLPQALTQRLHAEASALGLLAPHDTAPHHPQSGDDGAASASASAASSGEEKMAGRMPQQKAEGTLGPDAAKRANETRPTSSQSRRTETGARSAAGARGANGGLAVDNSDAMSTVSTVRSASRLASTRAAAPPRPGSRTVTAPNGTTAPVASKRSRSGPDGPAAPATAAPRTAALAAGGRRIASVAGNENSRPGAASANAGAANGQAATGLNRPPAANTRSHQSHALLGLGPGRTNLHPEQPVRAASANGRDGGAAASGASASDDKEVAPLSQQSATARRATRAGSATAPSATGARARSTTATSMGRSTSRTGATGGVGGAAAARPGMARGASAITSVRRGAPLKKTGPGGAVAHVQGHSSSSDADAGMEGDARASAAQARFEATNALKEEASKALTHAILEAKRWAKADAAIVDMLRVIGEAYRSIRTFRGKRAIWLLRSVPNDIQMEQAAITIDQVIEPGEKQVDLAAYTVLDRRIRRAPLIQTLIGRAYHDMSLYAEAERYFATAREGDPTQIASMDIYALVLFHLNREVALSALAQELMLIDPKSAVAHLAAGNAFSLQREHALALKCFRRAILLNPACAYAYTLAGLESLELRNSDDARNFFRAAIRCERRHWNAWSALGQIYLLDEQYPYAEFHYRIAASINRQNAVLFDLLGWVMEMKEERTDALAFYKTALSLNPSMAMTILRLGELLQKMGRVHEAHENFLKACMLAPDEARVHILLAKSYMRLSGGYFAPLDGGDVETHGDGDMSSMMDAAGIMRRRSLPGGAAGRDAAVKATGAPKYGAGYETAIAHHLAVAIDLDPRATRTIKAMGEGVHAALQSAAKKGGIFDPSGMASRSVSLNDPSLSHFASTSIMDSSRALPVYQDTAGNATADASTSAAQYVEPDEPSAEDSRQPPEDDERDDYAADDEQRDDESMGGDDGQGDSEGDSSSMVDGGEDDVDMSGVL